MASELCARIRALLDSVHVLSLATRDGDGIHAASLFYARDGIALLWLSEPHSRHSIPLERPTRVAITIAPDYEDFARIRGLQLSGVAFRVTDPAARERGRRSLEDRFAFLRGGGQDEVRDAYSRALIYRFEPDRITLIDNTRGLGFKETLELGPSEPRA